MFLTLKITSFIRKVKGKSTSALDVTAEKTYFENKNINTKELWQTK